MSQATSGPRIILSPHGTRHVIDPSARPLVGSSSFSYTGDPGLDGATNAVLLAKEVGSIAKVVGPVPGLWQKTGPASWVKFGVAMPAANHPATHKTVLVTVETNPNGIVVPLTSGPAAPGYEVLVSLRGKVLNPTNFGAGEHEYTTTVDGLGRITAITLTVQAFNPDIIHVFYQRDV